MDNKFAFCLWFDGRVEEIADYYLAIFETGEKTLTTHYLDDLHGTKGDILTIKLLLDGSEFILLNGGAEFHPTPAVSYVVTCNDEHQARELWHRLSTDGEVLMAFDRYEEFGLFGWTNDPFGISWQVRVDEKQPKQMIMPCLLFANHLSGKAEEAVNTWTSIFPKSKIIQQVFNDDETLNMAQFELNGQPFLIINSGIPHEFDFSLANSFYVYCDGQPGIDHKFYALIDDGGETLPCGWVTDKYGVAWQLVTKDIDALFDDRNVEKSYQAMQALYGMNKIDIEKLRRVYDEG